MHFTKKIAFWMLAAVSVPANAAQVLETWTGKVTAVPLSVNYQYGIEVGQEFFFEISYDDQQGSITVYTDGPNRIAENGDGDDGLYQKTCSEPESDTSCTNQLPPQYTLASDFTLLSTNLLDVIPPNYYGSACPINNFFFTNNTRNRLGLDSGAQILQFIQDGRRIWSPDGTIETCFGRINVTWSATQIVDFDNDGVYLGDNCPNTPNADQADIDGDLVGDVCDIDNDNDGVENSSDNCEFVRNQGQEDNDYDGIGDACDPDDDNDNVNDDLDNCPLDFNPGQENTDGMGAGDACLTAEQDRDSDRIENPYDNCPDTTNTSQIDFDFDDLGDACDPDDDNDRITDAADDCPNTPVDSVVGPSGCTVEQACPCENPRGSAESWRNHGQYVSCVSQTARLFVQRNIIEESLGDLISERAQQNSCGGK